MYHGDGFMQDRTTSIEKEILGRETERNKDGEMLTTPLLSCEPPLCERFFASNLIKFDVLFMKRILKELF
jgi:hypothetical protein